MVGGLLYNVEPIVALRMIADGVAESRAGFATIVALCCTPIGDGANGVAKIESPIGQIAERARGVDFKTIVDAATRAEAPRTGPPAPMVNILGLKIMRVVADDFAEKSIRGFHRASFRLIERYAQGLAPKS
jgi:hypothetical protein